MVRELLLLSTTFFAHITIMGILATRRYAKSTHKFLSRYCWVYRTLFGSFPSLTPHDRRWALFQTLVSFSFFFIGLGFAMLAIDLSPDEGRTVGVDSWVLFGIGMVGLAYTFCLGAYYYNKSKTQDNGGATQVSMSEQDVRKLI